MFLKKHLLFIVALLFVGAGILRCSYDTIVTGEGSGSVVAGIFYLPTIDGNSLGKVCAVRPASGARVTLRSSDYRPQILDTDSTFIVYSTTTDDSGRFRFSSIPDNTYIIEGISSDSIHVAFIDSVVVENNIPTGDADFVDTLKIPGTLRGTISLPDSSGEVYVYIRGTNHFTQVDSDGNFSLEGLPEGTYQLLFRTETNGSQTSEALEVITVSDSTIVIDTLYDIIYHNVEDISGTVPVDGRWYTNGESATVIGNIGNLKKVGYTLLGWTDSADETGTLYVPGDTLIVNKKNITLFPLWTDNPTLSAIYDGNGNTSGTTPPTNNYEIGSRVAVPRNSGDLMRDTFNFIGWNTEPDGSGVGYPVGTSFIIDSNNVTLYAWWTKNKVLRVIYHDNGSTGGRVPVDVRNYLRGDTVTVAGNIGHLVRSKYVFSGWNTEKEGNGTHYDADSAVIIGDEQIVLYAQWSSVPVFMVTYDKNGTDDGEVPVDTQQYYDGDTVVLITDADGLIKDGYTFRCWSLSTGDNSDTVCLPDEPLVISAENITLYAQWNKNPAFNVLYDPNGAESGEVPVDTQKFEAGDTVTVVSNSGELIKDGYTFYRWYQGNESDPDTVYFPGDAFIMSAEDVTLYAQWNENPAFTVTYDANDADAGSVPIDTQWYASGDTIIIAHNSGHLSKEWYTFLGWHTTIAAGSDSVYQADKKIVMDTEDLVLYAQWKEIPAVTLIYMGNGNTGGSSPPKQKHIIDTVIAIGNAGTLTRTGYSFTGWNTEPDGTGDWYYEDSSFTISAENDTLYAQWEIKRYTVTYIGNGNDSGDAPQATRHPYGAEVIVSGTGDMTRTGYTFYVWNTHSDHTLGDDLASGVTFSMPDSNVTLYARWTINTYTITYNLDGGVNGDNPDSYTVESSTINFAPATREFYSFGGWNIYVFDGEGTYYQAVDSIPKGSTGNLQVMARWNSIYTITFDDRNAATGQEPVSMQVVRPAITLDSLPAAPSRAALDFSGWYTGIAGTGNEFTTDYAISYDMTLYALWTISDIDGNVYRTVTIGSQTWMAENLKTRLYRDSLPLANVPGNSVWDTITSPAFCWYDNDSALYNAKYGILYNWYAVADTNTHKLAPSGWHVPSDADWAELENYLIENGYNWDSTTTGNKIGKSLATTTEWGIYTSDQGAVGNDVATNNSTGFSAFPCGYRSYIAEGFNRGGYDGYWRSTTETDSVNASYRRLTQLEPDFYHGSTSKRHGYSVRCIKDQ